MDRREFLKRSVLLTAGAVVGSRLLAEGTFSKTPHKIVGLQLYSLRDAMKKDVPGTLKKTAKMGYQTLETAGYGDGKLYGYAPAEFRKMCEDLGMQVMGAHLGRSYTKETDAEVMDWWKQALDAQAEAGCSYAVQASYPIGEKLDDIKLYCDYFNQVGAEAKKRGLRFGYHNHAKEFEKREGEVIYDYMVANTDPTNVMFELDVYWAQKGGVNPVDYIRKYAGRIPLLHIKDEQAIGESGTMDFKSIFDAAYDSGLESYFVEVERYGRTPEKDVAEIRRASRRAQHGRSRAAFAAARPVPLI